MGYTIDERRTTSHVFIILAAGRLGEGANVSSRRELGRAVGYGRGELVLICFGFCFGIPAAYIIPSVGAKSHLI